MKKYLVIGLGNFGINISQSLIENGCEVLGIDTDREIVQAAKDTITHAVIGDASNKLVLNNLSIKDFDGAIVSIGQQMASSILISLYLKEIGMKKIVVRAISEDHAKILIHLGVSDIVFPERDMAIRLGKLLSMKNTLDYLPLTEEYAILEVNPPESFIGKSLKDLNIGAKYGCQVLGIKYEHTEFITGKELETRTITDMVPPAGYVIPPKSVLIVLGKHSDIEKMQNVE